MRKPGYTGSFWPSEHQELLLKAALLEPEDAIPAWRAARATLDLDRLEPGSYSLMPLVYRSLQAAEVDDPLLPRLKGIHRHTWSKNQLVHEDAAVAREALGNAGVAALAVGGLSRLTFYPKLGLRTMAEFELLCRPDDVDRALRALGSRESVPSRVLRGRSTVRVESAGGRSFALHWRLLPEFPLPGADDDEDAAFWAAAEQRAAGRDLQTRMLAPADELLHVCASGARTALWANVQWVADAAVILRSGDIDWDRFLRVAAERRAAPRLREALTYIGEVLAVAVPSEVVAGLERFPATRRDRLALQVGGAGGRLLGEFPRTLARYIRSSDGRSPLGSILGLPHYLRDVWNVDRGWTLPGVVARKGAATIARRGGRGRRR
ncbi:MAG TPA: nucleotidyltransferase family protein [Gaiellaceae bacterium]|nr:nucleotidyltransferase family protein [Gaiellaceae bacterium]